MSKWTQPFAIKVFKILNVDYHLIFTFDTSAFSFAQAHLMKGLSLEAVLMMTLDLWYHSNE